MENSKNFSGKCGRVIYELVCLGVKKRDIWRCLVLVYTEFADEIAQNGLEDIG